MVLLTRRRTTQSIQILDCHTDVDSDREAVCVDLFFFWSFLWSWSRERMISVVQCVRTHCAAGDTRCSTFLLCSPRTCSSRQATSSTRRPAAVKGCYRAECHPEGSGALGHKFEMAFPLEPNPIAGQAFWYRSSCAGTIRCYMGQRKHAYVHSKTGLNHAQYSHPPLP